MIYITRNNNNKIRFFDKYSIEPKNKNNSINKEY